MFGPWRTWLGVPGGETDHRPDGRPRAAIDPAPFGRRALEEDRGCFTSRGYLFPTDDPWQHDRPQAKQADRKPSIRERLEQSKQECRNKNKAQAPRKGKSEPEL